MNNALNATSHQHSAADRTPDGPKRSLSQQAYQEIYQRIMTLSYTPGQRLEEKRLVAELGIGRTPVREALMRLADDFMVESHPHKGAVVRPMSLPNTRAVFSALRILECGVAELAVQAENNAFLVEMEVANQAIEQAMATNDLVAMVSANSRFHHSYARCSQNSYLVNALHKVRCETNRLACLSYGTEVDPEWTLQTHYRTVIEEHERIIETIKTRNLIRLTKTIIEHIRAFQQRIVKYMTT
jgi:DNA-binding GntR family transcriptional regulator